MASKAAVATQQEAVMARLQTVTAALSSTLGIEPPDLPTVGRWPDILHVQQLEALATWLEGIEIPSAKTETVSIINPPAKRSHKRKAPR